MRVGPRFRNECAPLEVSDGSVIAWSQEIKYLGVILVAGSKFKVDLSGARRSFNRATNCILVGLELGAIRVFLLA